MAVASSRALAQDDMSETVAKVSTRKPKGQGGDRRREIMDAAREIYWTEGYEQTTIRRVAERVGVSSTALYVYFKDKNAMIAAICDEVMAPLAANAQNVQAMAETAKTAADIERLLRQFCETYVRFWLGNPMVYFRMFMDLKQLSWNHRAGTYDSAADFQSSFNLFTFAVGLIETGRKLGLFRSGDPDLLAEVCWSALHGLVAIRVTDPKAPYAPVDDHIRTMIDILMQGMRA